MYIDQLYNNQKKFQDLNLPKEIMSEKKFIV